METVDVEKLEMALVYVGRIADGLDPVDGMPALEDSVLNDANVIRSMYFAKDVLNAVKSNGGTIGRKPRVTKKEFPPETLENFKYVEDKTITKLVEQLNAGLDTDVYKKLTYKTITDWLKENEYLEEVEDDYLGHKATVSTKKGNAIGITHSLQRSMTGREYYRVVYDREAQEFVVNIIPAILNY